MSIRTLTIAVSALALAAGSSAEALVIKLSNIGGVTAGSQADLGFKAAAAFWEHALSNNITVNLNVGYSALGAGIIGSTGSTQYSASTSAIESALRASATTTIDSTAVANLPTLTGGALKVITSGYKTPATKAGVSTLTKVYDSDTSANNKNIVGTSANLKALGFTGMTGADASITFSSNFAFDFNPDNGISAGQIDFVGVAIHEIGHALGFISGVDTYDYYGAKGPGKASTINLNNYAVGTVLDLFRYSTDSTNLVAGTAPVLDWSVGTASYFSINGGSTIYGGGSFATGAYNGDGRQASHWKDAASGVTQIGVMDPTIGYGQRAIVTATDLAAFDAIGWNPTSSALTTSGYTYLSTLNTTYVANTSAVPEPASWALLITGFGLVGGALRRRRAVAA